MANNSNYILLNKPFAGGWIDEDGHIAHEIINYFKADNEEHYFYNLPQGKAPSNEGNPQYIFLTSRVCKNEDNTYEGYVEYVLIPKQEVSESEIEKITYDGVPLKGKKGKAIYCDKEKPATYKIEKMYALSEPKKIVTDTVWRTERIIAEGANEYKQFIDIAKEAVNDKNLFKPSRIDATEDKKHLKFSYNTFLDLIGKSENEDCYTNILYRLFNDNKGLFKKFIKEKKGWNIDFNGLEIKKEVVVQGNKKENIVGGRMDIYAYDNQYKIVIENKIESGLNGDKKNGTQLMTYWKKIVDNCCEDDALLIIFVPDRHYSRLEEEMKSYNSLKELENKFKLLKVKYSEIYEFVKGAQTEIKTAYWNKYANDILELLNRQGTTADLLHKSLFFNAIKKSKNN